VWGKRGNKIFARSKLLKHLKIIIMHADQPFQSILDFRLLGVSDTLKVRTLCASVGKPKDKLFKMLQNHGDFKGCFFHLIRILPMTKSQRPGAQIPSSQWLSCSNRNPIPIFYCFIAYEYWYVLMLSL
jgi:hypothetical protein